MRLATLLVGGVPTMGLRAGGAVVAAGPAADHVGIELTEVHDVLGVIRAGDSASDPLEALSTVIADTRLPSAGEGVWWWHDDDAAYDAPFRPPKNAWTTGSNYLRHIEIAFARIPREVKLPARPEFFTKSRSAVCGPYDDVVYDRRATQTIDYENELAIVIGKAGKDIPRESALDHVFGYSIVNDVSARELQLWHGQFHRGKSLSNFCPLGPVVTTKRDMPDLGAVFMRTWVNGDLRQDWPVDDMVFKVDELVSNLSQGMTLEPGDIIICGTGPGVGFEFLPQRWLQHGDVVECEIDGIGRLRNTIKMAGVR